MTIIAGIKIPDSAMAREATELIRDTESELLFHHSTRVFLFGALTGERKQLKYDPELLYIGAMFHDIGLTAQFRTSQNRFEVDSANAARRFLRNHRVPEDEIDLVWDAIALHTTPGIPQFKKPVVQLVTAGVEMDVLGFAYDEFTEEQRLLVVNAHPRGEDFKERLIDAFNEGMKHRPDSTFGTANDDVLALKDPSFRRMNFCNIILGNAWNDSHYACICQDPTHQHV
ncbi:MULTISPECIES: HD domain-containing protein [unclassified Caballeronia]|uniref:HD domain-containing protein n=1 Tax=unclassified Caballeronia TaxID=2646786 RepID=UPI001F2A40F9|nr:MULTISPECIES: HD domain-containing protein [unclassified Caballeronia]MCE4547531.1 HD domain-containing protein [Caballeronia sp. PC1]MCE4574989.1 HD domain-containing protein [Caballeronia sp. CLC5]